MNAKAAPANENEAQKSQREQQEAKEQKIAEMQAQLKKTAEKRMPRVLDAVHLVGGLAVYQPTPEQQKKLVDALKKAVAEVEDELKNSGAPKQSRFQL